MYDVFNFTFVRSGATQLRKKYTKSEFLQQWDFIDN